ncbi:para-aminobenzoate synthetase component 1 [Robiginitalea myxolifaciens]|uniref:Para-aminobenzoate synthetase component 1 n=1 Tax=Robiginitalea myxolifaciens TaxID=400055 RepID=A0A1I6H0D1_9FLAO|nr:anthranilate synthase component I family protein [Robiginitalea myxolifaciens]SFR47904.1 para-aminobenzoate synthetase component 1 [Robiginitalea myxolifaciens]
MQRTAHKISILPSAAVKEKLVRWSSKQAHFAWLDSNRHSDKYGAFEALLAVGNLGHLASDVPGAFDKLGTFYADKADWILGYLSYDLKNDLEALSSDNPDRMGFPELYFFQPEKIIEVREAELIFRYPLHLAGQIREDWEAIQASGMSEWESDPPSCRIRMGMYKEQYLNAAQRLLEHIGRGDIYEVNFCQEFFAETPELNPLRAFMALNQISQAPFASFLRFGQRYLISASPERFLRKVGTQLISQPMKGTAPRSSDIAEDQELAAALLADPKERAENIMITDLVRNDLSKSALKGSVEVSELCALRSYKQVHQMISTVTSRISPAQGNIELLKDAFPMGSMTGAPKISALNLIEQEEQFRRGVYSGALGYMDPEGGMDFNVVIRSIVYDANKGLASFAVGSALTAGTAPLREYRECLLKARAMREVLEGKVL